MRFTRTKNIRTIIMKANLVDNIDKLISGTISGKISWVKLNENTFVWQTSNSENKRLNIILQTSKTFENKIVEILFRLFEVDTKKVLMDVKTESTSDENKKKIYDLYQTVKDSFGLSRLDVLSDLLKDL